MNALQPHGTTGPSRYLAVELDGYFWYILNDMRVTSAETATAMLSLPPHGRGETRQELLVDLAAGELRRDEPANCTKYRFSPFYSFFVSPHATLTALAMPKGVVAYAMREWFPKVLYRYLICPFRCQSFHASDRLRANHRARIRRNKLHSS